MGKIITTSSGSHGNSEGAMTEEEKTAEGSEDVTDVLEEGEADSGETSEEQPESSATEEDIADMSADEDEEEVD